MAAPPPDYDTFISFGIFALKAGPSLRWIEIHKGLLSSVSEEFRNHTFNEMTEGTSDEMILANQREGIVALFVQWAYTGDYPDPSVHPSVTSPVYLDDLDDLSDDYKTVPLMAHTRLYVFADRFNVQVLKLLAFDRLTAEIMKMGIPRTSEKRSKVIYLLGYAFESLPIRVVRDQLLEYLGSYASYSPDSLRMQPEFFDLLESDLDFMKELFRHAKKGDRKPWDPVGSAGKRKLPHRCVNC